METFDGNIQVNRYDAEGLRHEMEENGSLVKFIFNPDREAVVEESSSGLTRYIRSSELIARNTDAARTYYHYVSDEMGSTTHIVDENGIVLNHYDYDAWGNLTAQEEAVPNRFRFTDQQYQLSQHNTMLPPTVLRRADLKYKTKNHRGTIMSLIVFKRPIIQFYLYTTKPFHNRKSAIDFLRLIRSYGPYYLPTKYDFFEPIKQIFNSNDEKKFVRTCFGGSEITDKEAQEQNCEGGFIAKGKPPSKIDYHIMWEHKENTDRFNMICVFIAIPFLKKSSEHMAQFVHFCDDLACLYSPVHAEIRDYISSIPCECTESAFIPDNLNLRCPALKWRTYFGPPYIKLLGKDTILNAPCYKTEEVGETIVLQLTKSVFEDIPSELRQEVVNYFEASVDPAIRLKLGTGFLFRPFYASESFSPKNKLVPEFNFDEKNFIPKPNSD